jgi:two-component system, NarL family, sensor histidine kinase DevS
VKVDPARAKAAGHDSAAYEAMYAHSLDAVVFSTADGRILAANPAACELLRMTEAEICEGGLEGFADLAEPRWREAHAARAKDGKVRAELSMRRGDGTRFVAEVSSAVFTDAAGNVRACSTFRDVTPRWRAEQRLRASNELSRALLAGEPSGTVMGIAAEHARQLVEATHGGVLTVGKGRGSVVVAAASGPGVAHFVGVEYVPGTLAGRIMEAGQPVQIADLSGHAAVSSDVVAIHLGPALVVPMTSAERSFGVIVVARPSGAIPFSDEELRAVATFAESAAVALAYREAQTAAQRLAVLADQDRIARDLHDRVIQQLFAIGLDVQAAKRLADGPTADRLGRVVADIDDVITDVRATIYDLQPPRAGSLASEVHILVAEAGESLGFLPRVVFHGQTDTSAAACEQMLTVLREALSNVVRHANASEVEVIVDVGDEVALIVTDNGAGLAEMTGTGHGIPNMTQRARALGGDLLVTPAQPTGTRLEWRAPADRPPPAR